MIFLLLNKSNCLVEVHGSVLYIKYIRMKNKKKMGQAVAFGIALGTLVGIITDNLAIWLPVGIAIGAGIGQTRSRQPEEEKET